MNKLIYDNDRLVGYIFQGKHFQLYKRKQDWAIFAYGSNVEVIKITKKNGKERPPETAQWGTKAFSVRSLDKAEELLNKITP